MDATLSYGIPRINASGTLLEGIALWGELKPLLTHEAVKERALRYCDWAVSMGLLAIRTHVDVCDDRLLAVEALLEVKREVAPYIDLQLVAFPQDGFYRSPTARENTIRALDMGVDVVGGIPHFERTMADGTRSVTEALRDRGRARPDGRHALRRDRRPAVAPHRALAYRDAAPRPAGPGGRLAPHLDAFDGQLLRLQAAAADRRGRRVGHPNPLINIMLQGRHDTYPKRRGMTRVQGDAGAGHPRRLGPGLRARPLVFARHGRHAGRRLHGPARGADVVARRHARCFDMVTTSTPRSWGSIISGGGDSRSARRAASLVVLDAG
jgi:cytosine deaminase